MSESSTVLRAMRNLPARILFLDVDGVLNSTKYFESAKDRSMSPESDIDPKAVRLLNKLVREGDLEVVLSSTWRLLYPTPGVQKFLAARGFKSELAGSTPDLSQLDKQRGDEIQMYLSNLDVPAEAVIILDDFEQMGKLDKHLVRTNEDIGLTQYDVKHALSLLEHQLRHK